VPAEVTLIDKRENTKGQTVTNLYKVTGGNASLGLHPGRHHITAEASGFVTAEWVIDAEPASSHTHQFQLAPEKGEQAEPAATGAGTTATPPPPGGKPVAITEPPKEPKPSTPTSVYIGLAATGVFTGAAVATGIITMKKSKDLDLITNEAEANDKKGDVKTWALVTDIAIGAAVLSAGATAYFYFSAPKSAPEKSASTTRVQFTPFVTPTSAGGAVFGRF
jgi:hypothetical protein